MDSKEVKPVLPTNFNARFAPPGHLLFLRDGALMAQEMDPASLKFRGDAVRIADALNTDVPFNLADFSVSRNGVLALNSAVYQYELVWLDRAGNRLGAGIPVTQYAHPTLSPNGKQAVFEQPDAKPHIRNCGR